MPLPCPPLPAYIYVTPVGTSTVLTVATSHTKTMTLPPTCSPVDPFPLICPWQEPTQSGGPSLAVCKQPSQGPAALQVTPAPKKREDNHTH